MFFAAFDKVSGSRINVRITIGSKTIDCSDRTIGMTKLLDYYEIKECALIK